MALMLGMALLFCCFGIGSMDFFETGRIVIKPLSNLANYSSSVLDIIIDDGYDYDVSTVVHVLRFYFEDGAEYCDVICPYLNPFAAKQLAYSSNPKVVDVSAFRVDIKTSSFVFWWEFFDISGNVVYKHKPFSKIYELRNISYGEYLREYQTHSSSEGWS